VLGRDELRTDQQREHAADEKEHEARDDESPAYDGVVDGGDSPDAGRRTPNLPKGARAALLVDARHVAGRRDHWSVSRYAAIFMRTSSDRSWYSGIRLRGLTESLYAIHHAAFSGVFASTPAPIARRLPTWVKSGAVLPQAPVPRTVWQSAQPAAWNRPAPSAASPPFGRSAGRSWRSAQSSNASGGIATTCSAICVCAMPQNS